jgi:predicted transcriptional regulator
MRSDKKNKALILRESGKSLLEIAELVGISKSTASLWTKGVVLNEKAQSRLAHKKLAARVKAQHVLSQIRQKKQEKITRSVTKTLSSITYSPDLCKILCSYLYWGEGSKTGNAMVFMNSDPHLIQVFISLLRKAFVIDEQKFKVLIHIHEYHNKNEVLDYWSKVTSVPRTQFFKPYHKQHTGKNQRVGYMGSCSLRYYDVAIVRELKELYNASSRHILKKVLDE